MAVDLAAVAQGLRAQATASRTLVLDGRVLTDPVRADLRLAFGLAAGADVTVAGVQASDVPDPVGGTITITAGTAALLRQTALPATLELSASPDGQTLELVVGATMASGWAFPASFPAVAELFPFDLLPVTGAHFLFATSARTAHPWPGDASASLDLAAGLNFAGHTGLSAFPAIGQVLGNLVGPQDYRLWGLFGPTATDPLPVGSIRAPLASGTFAVGAAPNALTLANPAVAVVVGPTPADGGFQPVDLQVQADFQEVLQVSISVPVVGTTIGVGTDPLPNRGDIDTIIEALPGGQGFRQLVPAELHDVFAEVGLDHFGLVLDPTTPKVTYLTLALGTTAPWTVIDDVLVLESVGLRAEVLDPTGIDLTQVTVTAEADFLPDVFPGRFDFLVALQKAGGSAWEVEAVSGAYFGPLDLGTLVEKLLGSADSVPAELHDIQIADFGVAARRPAAGQPYDYTFWGTARAALPAVDGSAFGAELYVLMSKTPTSYAVHLAGAAAIGSSAFTVTLDLATAGSQLSASWTGTGDPLGFADIARVFGWYDLPAIPPSFDLGLDSAAFTLGYHAGATAFLMGAHSVNYGSAVFQTDVVGTQRVMAFGVDVPLHVTLADIPLVGDKLPGGDQLGIAGIGAWLVSRPLTKAEVGQLNRGNTLPATEPRLPDRDITTTATLFGSLLLGGAAQAVDIPVGAPPTPPPQPPRALPAPGAPAIPAAPAGMAGGGTPPATPSDLTTWWSVERTFGVFTIHRVGLEYRTDGSNTLFVTLDAAIALGPLAVDMLGLALGSPLDHFAPAFQLRGLGVAYDAPPLKISGALYALPANQLGTGVEFQYDGTVVVEAASFGLAAVASYAQQTDGSASLFVFAQLRLPLGGPPAFFVTGLMAGFGFNRALTLPAQDEVLSFPLLVLDAAPGPGQPAPASDPAHVLAVLEGTAAPPNGQAKAWIAPRSGTNWLAVGLEFTSFELVQSRAMLVAEWGDELVLALLGLSTLRLPQGAPDAETYVFVELELEAVLRPQTGFFGLTAILSPNSYVIAPAAKLTGGFAFFLWYGDNLNAGQFAITIGGYHPAFRPPPFFPQVPRVGFGWAVSDLVSIKGSAYFALTTSCVMAGGGLEVLFQSGNLSAWFTAQADLLVSWNPFSFQAGIAVSIGVAYKLDIFGISKTISLSLGASVSLWGPPTGGTVTVHLWIVSFTVDFGAGQGSVATDPLSKPEFADLLPAKALTAAVTGGLKSSATDPDHAGQDVWVVRTGGFSFSTESAVPATTLAYGGANATAVTTVATGATLDVRPMDVKATTATHTVRVQRLDDGSWHDLTTWSPTVSHRRVPASLWGEPHTDAQGHFTQLPPTPSNDLVDGTAVGASFRLPGPELGATTGVIELREVAYEPVADPGRLPIDPAVAPTDDFLPVPSATSIGQVAQVGTGSAAGGRTGLLGALSAAQLYDGGSDPMTTLGADAEHLFTDPPLLVEATP